MKKLRFAAAFIAVIALSSFTSRAQCTANFIAQAQSGTQVQFVASPVSTGTTMSYSWQFGDNTFLTVDTSVVTHNYSSNGIYTVTLAFADTISASCYTTVTHTISVNGGSCNDSINFSWTPGANGMMQFYGNSWNNPSYAYSWDFGDGDTSNLFSPAHTYTAGGTYTVTLTGSTTPNAVCTYSVTKVVTVSMTPCPVNASFSSTVAGNTATLVSTSTGTSASSWYHWYLGDGNQAYGPSVVHTYSNGGVYIAGLTVQDSSNVLCEDSVMQSVGVWGGVCLVNVSFVVAKDSSQALTWYIYPYISGSISNILWSWGDGSTSTSLYTSHTYSAAGTYSICLSATATCGSDTTVCNVSNIYRTRDNEVISVTVVDVATGLKEQVIQNQKLSIVPNPSTGQLLLKLPGVNNKPREIRVFDMIGKEVYSSALDGSCENGVPVNLESLSPGTYFVVLNGDGGSFRGKLILTE